jgi:citrate synthase
MFTKTMFALAFALATASGALAATKSQSTDQGQNVYNPRGAYVGTDPDLNVRFELRRDSDRGF